MWQVELQSCFRPGDLLRAEVISPGDSQSCYLSTAKNELGVILAKSLAGGCMDELACMAAHAAPVHLQLHRRHASQKLHAVLACYRLHHCMDVLIHRPACVHLMQVCLWFPSAGRKCSALRPRPWKSERWPSRPESLHPSHMATQRIVFVTVGTTKFEALIKALDTPQTVIAIADQGFTKLIVQLGAGSHTPAIICPAGQDVYVHANGLEVQWFRFAPSLKSYMKAASLIISHAGSGSLFEALQLGKAVIAVPNSILMHNHQAELADHLEALGHLLASSPVDLLETLQSMELEQLRPYTPENPAGIAEAIDSMMGISP